MWPSYTRTLPFYHPFKNVLTFERTVTGYIFLFSTDNSSNPLWLPCTLPEYRMLFQLCTEVGTVVKDHARLPQELQPSWLSLLLNTQLKRPFYFLLQLFYCRVISLSEHVSPRTKLLIQAWGRVFYQLNILEGPWKYFLKSTAILNM